MKKVFMVILTVLSIFVFAQLTYAVQPIDGHYEGTTSQGGSIAFDIVAGEFQSISWDIHPMCSGRYCGFSSWGATFYGEYFTHVWNVIQDGNGYAIGIESGANIAIFVWGTFDISTHATGGIWHAVPYFTGNGLDITSCLDTNITYEANYVGAASPQAFSPESSRKRIIINND